MTFTKTFRGGTLYYIYFLFLTLFLSCQNIDDINLDATTEGVDEEVIASLRNNPAIDYVNIEGAGDVKLSFKGQEIILKINGLAIDAYNEKGNILVNSTFANGDDGYIVEEWNIFSNKEIRSSLSERDPEHGDQDFCECYANDLDKFCDGVAGCIAAAHPLVIVIIAAHCANEVGTSCDE
ncbi:hypothetical protein [Spongiimicrobium salis]|uniref:hypothetical protein n=1 Tax=Spongiimicrobium salis TaxID=1667022 RepID=UPI00374D7C42